MEYQTKFKGVKFPKTGEELESIGYDANSLRRLGAAIYSHFSKIHPGAKLPRALRLVFGGTKYITESIGISDNTEFKYLVQGARKVAKKAGDGQGVGYFSSLLVELRNKTNFSERERMRPYQTISFCDIGRNIASPGPSPEDAAISSDINEKTMKIMTSMEEHYRVIEDIGKNFNLDRERIREVETRALEKLKSKH